ncbi:MAG TPA: SPOR domain-containing protein [Burkholderiaceae bacterium]|nr:SPOR domain-containing protein [Burkholderiaceae bacterium]
MAATSNKTQRGAQRGGFALGVVVGLLVGLALALGVALYVTKVPVPFVDKVPQRTAEQDAAEAEKNRHWDPNAPLASKAGPPKPASGSEPAASAAATGPGSSPPAVPAPVAPAASFARIAPAAPAASAAASGVSAKPGAEAFVYYVQVAAFTRADEAEQLRARLALNGLMARVTEREQNGRTMYRVRLGPYDLREDAERVKTQALDVGYAESTLVRVNR